MSVSYAPIIKSVSITPNPVNTRATFRIAVEVESCDHARLQAYKHSQLSVFKHIQLATEKLNS